jgi:hypothetical protein
MSSSSYQLLTPVNYYPKLDHIMGLTSAQAARHSFRLGILTNIFLIPPVIMFFFLIVQHRVVMFHTTFHHPDSPATTSSTHIKVTLSWSPSPLTDLDTPPLRLAVPDFSDNTLEHFLPHGTQRTFQRLLQQPSRLALVKAAAPFPFNDFGLVFGQEWLCRNMTLSRVHPILCAPKNVIWDLRFLFHPPLKKRGVEALVILADSIHHVNKTLDMPPASHLATSVLSPTLSTYAFLNLATWTLVQHAHPSLFPTNEFGLSEPMVNPGRVFHPLSAPLVPSQPDTCVILDYGRTFLCAVFPRHSEINYVTYFQWLEFALRKVHHQELRLVQGPCRPNSDPDNPPLACPQSPGHLFGTRVDLQNPNTTFWDGTSAWLHAADWVTPFRCPDHLFTTPQRSGCNPRHFSRYQEVLGYPISPNNTRINIQFIRDD